MKNSLAILKNTDLIVLVESGDNKIFELLFNEISDDLKLYLNKITGNSGIARDIFQDTFLKASNWVTSKKYKAGNFKAWIYRIAHNLWIDHLRSNKTRRTVSIYDLPYDIKDPQKLKCEEDGYDWVKILTKLSYKTRETIILKYIHGLTFEELSKVLDISITACKARAWRGRMDLRKLLDI
jgi:RNA polymerase sigma-70 factor (ECF subfamily)